MNLYARLSAWLVVSWLATPCGAQMPDFPAPAPEHELLKRLVGDWETVSECETGPEGEPMTTRGFTRARMLGGRWVLSEVRFGEDDEAVNAQLTIGYDPERAVYVGAWVDGMTSHLWTYTGSYDEATRTLTMSAEGPNMMAPGETALYRDSYQFVSDDLIRTRSEARPEGGEWTEFMAGEMRRKPE